MSLPVVVQRCQLALFHDVVKLPGPKQVQLAAALSKHVQFCSEYRDWRCALTPRHLSLGSIYVFAIK